jgi:hypothetical protein
MALDEILYVEKVDLVINPNPKESKVVAADMNEIKNVVNSSVAAINDGVKGIAEQGGFDTKGYSDVINIDSFDSVNLNSDVDINIEAADGLYLLSYTNISIQSNLNIIEIRSLASDINLTTDVESINIDSGNAVVISSVSDVDIESSGGGISLNPSTNVFVNNTQVKQVADATDNSDAVNFGQIKALSGAGDPNGAVISRYIGDIFVRTDNNDIYCSRVGATDNEWRKIG